MHVVTQILNLGGPNAELIEHREKPWSSATFNGNCHYITLCFNGPEAIKEGQRFAQSIPEHEYSIPRHIVAESRVHSATYNTTPAPSAQLEIHVLLLEIA